MLQNISRDGEDVQRRFAATSSEECKDLMGLLKQALQQLKLQENSAQHRNLNEVQGLSRFLFKYDIFVSDEWNGDSSY